ncbi:MAG: acyl-CoA carboxylase subunit beta [bacterium]
MDKEEKTRAENSIEKNHGEETVNYGNGFADRSPEEILALFREKVEKKDSSELRQLLAALLDSDSFCEFEPLGGAESSAADIGEVPPGDSAVCGFGLLNNRRVALIGLDPSVNSGTLSASGSRKIVRLIKRALEYKLPLIILVDSMGINEAGGLAALAESVAVFHAFSRCEGKIPRISVLLGKCRQTACFFPGLSDIVIAVDNGETIDFAGQQPSQAIPGPEGGQAIVDVYAESKNKALEQVVRCLNYLPDNCHERSFILTSKPPQSSKALTDLVPADKTKPYDVKNVLKAVFDGQSFMELKSRYARNAVTGFARLGGCSVGVVANQPRYRAGTLDVRATEKLASFIDFCDRFSLPVITLVDLPGFLPAADQERRGLIRRAGELLAAYSRATVPLLTLITRKSYDASYVVMGSDGLGVDVVLAWPGAEIALTESKHEGNELYQFGDPWEAARKGYIDNVIKPEETRRSLLQHLKIILNLP